MKKLLLALMLLPALVLSQTPTLVPYFRVLGRLQADSLAVRALTMTGGLNVSGNMTIATTKWIGMGASMGRIVFTDASTDYLNLIPKVQINSAYYLPTADGTINQALVTNGAGVASWTSVGGLTPVGWTDGGTSIYNTTATDGIVIGKTAISSGYLFEVFNSRSKLWNFRVPTDAVYTAKNGATFDNTSDYAYSLTDTNLQVTNDFAIEALFEIAGTTVTNRYIVNKETGGVGYGLYVYDDDVYIRFDDNVTDASGVIIADVLQSRAPTHVLVNFDKYGYAKVWINGTYRAKKSISAVGDVTNQGPFRVGTESNGTSYEFGGQIYYVRLYNCLVDTSLIPALAYGASVPNVLLGASQTATYIADWSVNDQSWDEYYGTGSGNNDAVSDGATSRDNCYKYYASANNQLHRFGPYTNVVADRVSRYWFIKAGVYVPAAQTHTDGFGFLVGGQGGSSGLILQSCANTWIDTVTYVNGAGNDKTAGNGLLIYSYDGTASTFTGAGSDADDIIYLSSYEIYKAGVIGWWDFSKTTTGMVPDQSGNGNHLTLSGNITLAYTDPTQTWYRDFDNSRTILSNSDNVGIGDTTPESTLTVTGAIKATTFLKSAGVHLDANSYITTGSTFGETGYGLRDSSGLVQYKHTGGAWHDIGTIDTTKWNSTIDTVLDAAKLDLAVMSVNMINPNTLNVGKYVNWTTGALSNNASYTATDYMPVTVDSHYCATNCVHYAWYTSGLVFISGGSSISNPLTAPATAAYIRVDYTHGTYTLSQVQFENGMTTSDHEVYRDYWVKDDVLRNITYPRLAESAKDSIAAKVNSVIDTVTFENHIPFFSVRDIAIPDTLFFSTDIQNNIYYDNVVSVGAYKNSIPTIYSPNAGDTTYHRERYWRYHSTSATDVTGNKFYLYDHEFNKLDSVAFTIVMSSLVDTTANCKVALIGDSYSYAKPWIEYVDGLTGNLTWVGIRKNGAYGDSIYNEGRGGWCLSDYATVNKGSSIKSFSPFLLPAAPYKYYGNNEFWINSYDDSTAYGIANFGDIRRALGISEVTGLKSAPAFNDVVWDSTDNRYEKWSGAAWVELSADSLDFEFRYGRYLATFGVDAPDVVIIMLAPNTFNSKLPSQVDATFTTWIALYDSLVNSIITDVPGVKVGIVVPACPGNKNGYNDWKPEDMYKYVYWKVAKKLIEHFDNKQTSGIYLIDVNSSYDRVYSAASLNTIPNATYTGSETERIRGTGVHPNDNGYNQIGERILGFIQAVGR